MNELFEVFFCNDSSKLLATVDKAIIKEYEINVEKTTIILWAKLILQFVFVNCKQGKIIYYHKIKIKVRDRNFFNKK